ncbi:ubinuclein-1 isoform X2 [Gouania willdenowi]|nr:ubinuclein-1-like isoform X2 [Gouania willdenowi]
MKETSSADTETIRLQLELFETDEQHFPEFNYSQLLEQQGGQPAKTNHIQDIIGYGYGYDEDDSFIDNSEAYDEFVPASLTTQFGGFYVNSDVLHFHRASDPEIGLASVKKTPGLKRKPRRMQNDVQDKPKKKRCRPGDEMSNMKPQLGTISDIGHNKVKMRKKKKDKTLSVTSILKKLEREKEKDRLKTESQPAYSLMCGSTVRPFPADAAGCGGLVSADPLLCLIGSTNDHTLIQAANTADFDIDLDSLLDVTEENLGSKSLPQSTAEMKHIQSTSDDQNLMSICSETLIQTKVNSGLKPEQYQTRLLTDECTTPLTSHPWASMPEGLPPGLQKSIRKLMLAAKTSEGGSKLKFFSPNINSIMLDIELQCREQSGHLRSKVYTHLSSFLPCSRDTLLKRARKLAITHVEDHVGEEHLIQKLKEAIEKLMPEQIEWFQKSCQEHEQVKSLKRADDANTEDRGEKRGGPKKLFKWNGEIRECLGNVLKKKLVKYKKEGNDSQKMEDYIKTMLDELKPLWPKGWMQSRVLVRESKKLLGFNA